MTIFDQYPSIERLLINKIQEISKEIIKQEAKKIISLEEELFANIMIKQLKERQQEYFNAVLRNKTK